MSKRCGNTPVKAGFPEDVISGHPEMRNHRCCKLVGHPGACFFCAVDVESSSDTVPAKCEYCGGTKVRTRSDGSHYSCKMCINPVSVEGEKKMSGTNYIADREQAPEWVCFENGRTVGIAYPKEGHPYLVVDFEKQGERWLRAAAAAEDDAGTVNIGGAEDALASIITPSDPVPEDVVVLPERPKHSVYPAHCSGLVAMYPAYVAEEHFALLEQLLTVARQEARNLNAAVGHKEEILSEALKTITGLRADLAAIAADRNLWQDAHDEDCPNKAALEEETKTVAELRLELAESKTFSAKVVDGNTAWMRRADKAEAALAAEKSNVEKLQKALNRIYDEASK